MQGVDAKTALLVIDIQKDLTLGSFGQPCFDSSLIFRTATLIKEFSKKGALIIASKVFQPKDHCGFSGNANICRNLQDHKGHEFTVEQRYQSEVPDHCTYEERGFRSWGVARTDAWLDTREQHMTFVAAEPRSTRKRQMTGSPT